MEFSQIAILIVLAGFFGVIAKFAKQPLLIGYLFAGLILGITGIVSDTDSLANMGKIGVALLLFLLGLEMKLDELPTIGKVALFTGLGQIIFTTSIGFIIAILLGFETLPSVYIGVALAFSSTIIMVKLLSEKKDLTSLYGRIAIGFLLVQDFVAISILMFLSGVGRGGLGMGDYALIIVKAIFLFVLVWVLSKRILPHFFEKVVSNSMELLFVVSIAWALGVAGFVAGPMGFTLEIGGFLAGIALSNLPEHLQIASRTRPLRDFFLTIFFLFLGTHLAIGEGVLNIIPTALILSTFVLIGNPIIVLIILGFMGYKKRTSFLAGLTVAQISEFSLIVVAMGLAVGHLTDSHVALTVVVAAITMTVSTYMIMGADKLYKRLSPYLGMFERRIVKEKALIIKSKKENHVVLVGCDRTGRVLLPFLQKREEPFLVVDFNPAVFERLTAMEIDVVFGDINDEDIIEAAAIDDSRLILSTISNFADNLTLLEYLRTLKKKPAVVLTTPLKREAVKLYESGADYVIVPEIVTGDHIKHMLKYHGTDSDSVKKLGKSHFDRLLFT